MLEHLQVDLQIHEDDQKVFNELNDKVNDLYGFVFAFTNFISPLIGSKLYDHVGMRRAFDCTSVFNMTIAVIFFVFNCGFNFKKDN